MDFKGVRRRLRPPHHGVPQSQSLNRPLIALALEVGQRVRRQDAEPRLPRVALLSLLQNALEDDWRKRVRLGGGRRRLCGAAAAENGLLGRRRPRPSRGEELERGLLLRTLGRPRGSDPSERGARRGARVEASAVLGLSNRRQLCVRGAVRFKGRDSESGRRRHAVQALQHHLDRVEPGGRAGAVEDRVALVVARKEEVVRGFAFYECLEHCDIPPEGRRVRQSPQPAPTMPHVSQVPGAVERGRIKGRGSL
mmetsp:Transcript_5997/g.21350  ORF Transcript_5997/g.21350 Transcript_5997/m.21350 type:complete len:252 (+) Transcript_5997:130-885(+)